MTPQIAFEVFTNLTANELKRLQSCVVTLDGEHLFTFINPNTDYIKLKSENLALLSNTVGGETLEEVTAPEPVKAPKVRKKLVKAV